MGQEEIKKIYNWVPQILSLPSKHSWFDYDDQADVLYVSFKKPQEASDSQMVSDNIILRKRNNQVVGLTIMNASKIH